MGIKYCLVGSDKDRNFVLQDNEGEDLCFENEEEAEEKLEDISAVEVRTEVDYMYQIEKESTIPLETGEYPEEVEGL